MKVTFCSPTASSGLVQWELREGVGERDRILSLSLHPPVPPPHLPPHTHTSSAAISQLVLNSMGMSIRTSVLKHPLVYPVLISSQGPLSSQQPKQPHSPPTDHPPSQGRDLHSSWIHIVIFLIYKINTHTHGWGGGGGGKPSAILSLSLGLGPRSWTTGYTQQERDPSLCNSQTREIAWS